MENKQTKGKDYEVEEEMKMDKFYALLRRYRDARDRRRKELEELEKSEKKRMKVGTEQHRVWVPSFQWEDFTNEVQFRGQQHLQFPTSSTSPSPCVGGTDNKQRKHDDQHSHSLDLNLTL